MVKRRIIDETGSRKKVKSHQVEDVSTAARPIVKTLSTQRIQSLWPLVPQKCYGLIMNMIQVPLNPILHSIKSVKMADAFQQLLFDILLPTLKKRLISTPVPPRTTQAHYKPSVLKEQNVKLETVLVDLKETNQNLRKEIERELRKLEKDKKYLDTLKTNSRRQIRNLESLRRKTGSKYRATGKEKITGINLKEPVDWTVLKDEPVIEELESVLRQVEKELRPLKGLITHLEELERNE